MSSPLKVHIAPPDFGWLNMTLQTINEEVFITTSAVYDPYPEMLVWLESIANGNDASLSINDESENFYLKAAALGDTQVYFSVSVQLPLPQQKLGIAINRFHLVSEFYNAFSVHVSGKEFIEHWLEFLDLDDQIITNYKSNKLQRYLTSQN